MALAAVGIALGPLSSAAPQRATRKQIRRCSFGRAIHSENQSRSAVQQPERGGRNRFSLTASRTILRNLAGRRPQSHQPNSGWSQGGRKNAREIGRQLGVAHVLEGSVQRTKNRVRVSAQLIDARTDDHQWAEKYDRELSDGFAIQTEVAQAITRQLEAKLTAREKEALEPLTRDIAAFDLYLRAKLIKTFHDTDTEGYFSGRASWMKRSSAIKFCPGLLLANYGAR